MNAARSLAHLMDRLELGAKITLPLDAITQSFAVLATRRAGRTHAATVLVEEIVSERVPVVIVDSAGVWHGLRSSADGKDTGLPVHVLGGAHAAVSFAETSGRAVADMVLEMRQPVVLDLSSFSQPAARQFVNDLARQVLRCNREVMHLVVDQADALLTHSTTRDEAHLVKLLHAGRDSGIGVTLVTERLSLLSDPVLATAEVLIAARTTSPRDRAAVHRWIAGRGDPSAAADVAASLASLADDEAWIWSREWLRAVKRVTVRPRATFDGLVAPHVGTMRPPLSRAAADQLRRLHKKMTTTTIHPWSGRGVDDRARAHGSAPAASMGNSHIEPAREDAGTRPARRRGRPVEPLNLTRDEKRGLEQYARGERVPPLLAQRAQIVLDCAEGRLNGEVAHSRKVSIQAVGRWRRRFVEYRLNGLLLNLRFLDRDLKIPIDEGHEAKA